MSNNFINRKDRIIASAIEIISEAGLSSLTTKTLAMKENMSESLLYRYFGGIEEVLVEVIETFTRYDDRIIATIKAKDIPHISRVMELLNTFCIYYEGYYEMSAIILNYEEFLHNVNTREKIASCIVKRTSFIREELELAIAEGEIKDIFTPEELTNIFLGSSTRDLLNRRIQNDSKTHSQTMKATIDKIVDMLRLE